MKHIILSTRNSHKVEEIRSLLPQEFHFYTLADFPSAPLVHEDASTFSGNAAKKALELAEWLPSSNEAIQKLGTAITAGAIFVLADDSGLEVDALGGRPGVLSARFASDEKQAGNAPDAANNAKLLRLLGDLPIEKRTARFRCVLALAPVHFEKPNSSSPVCLASESELQLELFDGACEGRISFEGRGAKGFGYDPLFIPDGYELSFAELGETVKNRISHRAKALEKLKSYFSKRSP